MRYDLPMSDAERIRLLRDLFRGATSRNREFERFQRPEARRVLQGYRRLRSLLREVRRPDVETRARWVDGSSRLAVAVEQSRFGYRRLVFLDAWEGEFLLTEAQAPSGAVLREAYP